MFQIHTPFISENPRHSHVPPIPTYHPCHWKWKTPSDKALSFFQMPPPGPFRETWTRMNQIFPCLPTFNYKRVGHVMISPELKWHTSNFCLLFQERTLFDHLPPLSRDGRNDPPLQFFALLDTVFLNVTQKVYDRTIFPRTEFKPWFYIL